jgi:hypothetical protein
MYVVFFERTAENKVAVGPFDSEWNAEKYLEKNGWKSDGLACWLKKNLGTAIILPLRKPV